MISHPSATITIAAKSIRSMPNFGCAAFLAFIKSSCPVPNKIVETPMITRRHNDQIFRPVVERIAIFVMDNIAFWNWAKGLFSNMMVFKNPSTHTWANFAKSIVISAFASSDSYGAYGIAIWLPPIMKLPTQFCSTNRRTGNSAQGAVTLECFLTDKTNTEVLSHAAE
jgi:hypothetical protein